MIDSDLARMSKFVNYKKRSVTLPPGCKNLIDLSQPRRSSKSHSTIPSGEQPAVRRGESGTVKLGGIDKYVALPFECHAYCVILMLSLPDEGVTIDFTKMAGESMSVSVTFEEDPQRERLMREFFVARSLQLPGDEWTPTTHFVAGIPVQLIYRISPLPVDVTSASNLVADLFSQVCGLSAEDPLTFRYYELGDAGAA